MLQSFNPLAQSRGASNSKADEQMNVIRHEYISSYADVKVSCALAIFDKRFVYFWLREQARPSVSIECHKINRCIETLEDQIQAWRLIFEHSLHGRRCSARCPQLPDSELSAVVCAVLSAFDSRRQRKSAEDSGRYSGQRST